MSSRTPKKYWRYTIPAAVILTFVLSRAVAPLAETELKYLHGLINERGPSQFLMLVSGLSILLTYIMRAVRRDFSSSQAVFLALTLLIPLFFGIAGYVLGSISLESGYREMLGFNPTLEAVTEIEGNRMIGYGVAFDVLLLAGVVFITLFFFIGATYIACVVKERRRDTCHNATS